MAAISPTAIQLTAQQLRELADARTAHKYIRRAINVALFDGWAVAAFAFINGLCGLLGDFQSLIIGAALGVIAFIEIRGASQLRRLDESAPRRLAINQVLLGLLLCAYAVWRIYESLHGPSPYAQLSAADPKIGKRFEDMARSLYVAIYGSLIIFAIFAQGGAAVFYFTRQKHLHNYRHRTPAWILQMQQNGVMV